MIASDIFQVQSDVGQDVKFGAKTKTDLDTDADIDTDSDTDADAVKNLSASEKSKQIENYINTYKATYGVGLGSYGLMHMESLRTLVAQYYLEWPFDEYRNFYVKVGVFR